MLKIEFYIRLFLIFLISTTLAQVPDTDPYEKITQYEGPLDEDYKVYPGSGIYGGPDPRSGYGGDQNTQIVPGVYNPNTKLSFDIRYSDSFCPSSPVVIDDDDGPSTRKRRDVEHKHKVLLCCFHQLKIVDYLNPQCCSDIPFNPKTHICCGGQIIELHDAEHPGFTGCCKDKVYHRKHHVCCDNKLQETKHGEFSACCGTPQPNYYKNEVEQKVYDIKEKICCANRQLYSLQNLTGYPHHHEAACCLDEAYNIHEEMCCNLNIVKKPSNFDKKKYGPAQCCRSNAFIPELMLCCNGHVIDLTTKNLKEEEYKNQRCCGFSRYDKTKQKCCSGKIVDVEDGEENKYHKCCLHEKYDIRTQSCCNGVKIPEPANYRYCCGFSLYDKVTQTCCNQEYAVPKGTKCGYY